MKNVPTSHHPFQDVATNTDLYGPTVGPLQEQTWPNRSNGPPALEKNADTYLTKDNILISAASETGYSLLELYKECLFFSMEKTVRYCERLPYTDEKAIELNL